MYTTWVFFSTLHVFFFYLSIASRTNVFSSRQPDKGLEREREYVCLQYKHKTALDLLLCYHLLLLMLYPSASNLSHIRWVNHQLSHVGFVCLLVLCLQLPPPPPNQLGIAREEREQNLTTKINVSVREKLKINSNLHLKKHALRVPQIRNCGACVCSRTSTMVKIDA